MRPIDLLAPRLCVACGGWAGRAEPLCGGCRGQLRRLTAAQALGIWAAVAYAGPARDVVAALKFRGALRVADAMAAAVCAVAPPGWLAPDTVLVPVPLHPARRRRRGFNQAERLAAAIARRTGLEVRECLERSGSRATQMGRGRAERLEGIAGSIHAHAPIPPRAVLVDDVVTTGATLRACADVLREAGATEVRAVAYARTPGR